MTEIGNRQALDEQALEIERLRETVVALECQNAKALRIARESARRHEDGHPSHYTALLDVERVLSEAAHCPHAAELAVKDQAIEDIRALHVKGREVVVFQSAYNVCAGCEQPWPCHTKRVLADLSARLDQDKGDSDE